jgi:AraC-like DNA-binding protein
MPPRRVTDDSLERHRVGGYCEFAPPPALSDCVDSVWTHETPRSLEAARAAHRVLPDLGVSLGFLGFRDNDGRPDGWSPVIIGPKLRAQIFTLVPGRELTAIRLTPEWSGPLVGIDPMSIADGVYDLTRVSPPLADRVGAALARTRSAAEARHALVEIVQRLRTPCRTPPSSITSAALDLVRHSEGRLSCEAVASRLGLSERHVRRHVHDATGVAPKSYARAVRFVGAMMAADRVDRPSWADVALGAGYCDQSHLIRDAIAFACASPGDLHGERRRQAVDPATAGALVVSV